MKVPFINKNLKRLEKEKKRVEEAIRSLDRSNNYQNENNNLQEIELESRVEDLEIKKNNTFIKKNLSAYLQQIKDALSRANKKKYGVCARCGNEIASGRLEADPSAIYCLSCAELLEKANEAS